MIAKINQLLQEVEALKAANPEELEALRIKYLSKKGAINDLMADFRNVAAEQKKEVGMRLNELKNKAQEKIAALKEQFESQDTGCDDIDLTRSAYPIELGTRHPLSIVRNEIIDIFARMGFNIADGSADFRNHHIRIRLFSYAVHKFFNLIGNMRDHLNRRSQIFSSPLLIQNVPVHLSCCQIGILIQIFINEPLIMSQIQIGFRPVFRHIHFPMLIRAHRTGIYVNIGIQLLGCNL